MTKQTTEQNSEGLMDPFRTSIPPEHQPFLGRGSAFVSLGSCFADVMGRKLLENGWDGLVNPFGTLFHPFSIFDALKDPDALDPDLYLQRGELHYHYRLPKAFAFSDRSAFETEWLSRKSELRRRLAAPRSLLILTLGTSFFYATDHIWVANCHQQPARLFQKNLSTLDSMRSAWLDLFPALPRDLEIIVTVSPVRHLKDGLVDNALSKSLLRSLAHDMVQCDPRRIRYFPAFEIMIDELRDYRFYARDMLHPSDLAIDWIWQKFLASYATQDAKAFIGQREKVIARLQHRPLHAESRETELFLRDLRRDLIDLADPRLVSELAGVERRLSKFT